MAYFEVSHEAFLQADYTFSQMTPTLRFGVIYEKNVTLGMEVSFFTACPITEGLSVPRFWSGSFTSLYRQLYDMG
jgi:hypothetical protein